MTKNKKTGKNSKSKSSNLEKRKLVKADLGDQVYGIVEKALGGSYFEINCLDNVVRRCKVRSKRMRIGPKDCVIISLRDFDNNSGDIVYRYDSDEVRLLQKTGILPDSESLGVTEEEEVFDDGFVFEDI